MAKTIRHAFRAVPKIDEVAISTSGWGGMLRSTMIGMLSGTALSSALLVLGTASAGAQEVTTPSDSKQTAGYPTSGRAGLTTNRAADHRPVGDPTAVAQIHVRTVRRHICGRYR